MIENERKYILDEHAHVSYMRKLKTLPGAKTRKITQGYLNDNTRIRSSTTDDVVEYTFTFKQMTPRGLIEIENPIIQMEYDALWFAVENQITKTRIAVPSNDLIWEVDFFTVSTIPDPFLIMAEVEMAPGVEEPDQIPDFISERLIHLVARDDKRFLNSRMIHPMEVRRQVTKLKNGKL